MKRIWFWLQKKKRIEKRVLELCMQINPRNKVFICLTLKSVKSNICLGKEVRDYHGLFLIHSLYARCPKGNYG